MADDKQVIGRATIKCVRLSFPYIFDKSPPRKRDDGSMDEGNFRCSGIMYKSGKYGIHTKNNLGILKKAKEDVLAAKYGTDQKKWPKFRPDKLFIRDGNLENWDGYEDSWYVVASEKEAPLCLTRRKDPNGLWIPATKKELYAGCMVNMMIQVWIQDNEHGTRINANLKAVQFFEHNEGFATSAPIDPSQAFTEIEADEGEDMGGSEDFGSQDDDDDNVV